MAPPVPTTDDVQAWGAEVWRGGVNTWECDENGHMNVRFYVVKAMEALAGLAAALGMPRAYAPNANATLLVREQHIRFRREAHPGAALHIRGAVLEMDETDARLLLVMYHSTTGEPAATFQTVVSHVTPRGGRPFPWSSRTRERAAALTTSLPEVAAAGFAMTAEASRPGGAPKRPARMALVAALVVIGVLAIGDAALTPVSGWRAAWMGQSAMICPWRILAISTPAFAAIVWGLRSLAPTRLAVAGAAAGVLAGGIGATVYGLYCQEATAMFVATWYTLGLAGCAGVGALLGPRVLRW